MTNQKSTANLPLYAATLFTLPQIYFLKSIIEDLQAYLSYFADFPIYAITSSIATLITVIYLVTAILAIIMWQINNSKFLVFITLGMLILQILFFLISNLFVLTSDNSDLMQILTSQLKYLLQLLGLYSFEGVVGFPLLQLINSFSTLGILFYLYFIYTQFATNPASRKVQKNRPTFCPSCGSKISGNESFCSSCGKAIG